VRRNKVADWGIVTPKQVARSMIAFGKTHPEAHLRLIEVPQIPGTLRRSRPIRGISELFLKTKRYCATLIVIQPVGLIADFVLYEKNGRFRVGTNAEPVPPTFWEQPAAIDAADTVTADPATSSIEEANTSVSDGE
jgi:hypothetical protein